MAASFNNGLMFRRLLRRLLFANRGRLFVILLALSAGAAVSAALLNLQTDAKRRLTTEFRSFGANILVLPKSTSGSQENTMPELPATTFAPTLDSPLTVHFASLLYTIASAAPATSAEFSPVVVVGYAGVLPGSAPLDTLTDSGNGAHAETGSAAAMRCIVGQQVARQLNLGSGGSLAIRSGDRSARCSISDILKTGSTEDGQIFLPLRGAQSLADLPGRISAVQVNASGSSNQIGQFAAQLQQRLPDVEVRPLRHFTEAQAKIYSRISSLLTIATALILTLTILCVMAAMTNIAAERRNDVGMMKAIGGSARRVLNLFLTEAALLGLAGGVIGSAVGIVLSIGLGKAVFGVAAAPRLIVYPISVALTVIVAIFGAYPLRRLVNIRPATVFRGEA